MKKYFIYIGYIFFTAVLIHGCATEERVDESEKKAIKYINPDGLSKTSAYTQVITINSGRMVYISGQVPFNKSGELIGKGDFRLQALQAFENLQTALAGAGAGFKDVVKVTYFIKNYNQEHLPVIREMRAQYFDKENPPTASLVGVQSLFLEDVMIEIEAVASIK